jgi:hypothetical protein
MMDQGNGRGRKIRAGVHVEMPILKVEMTELVDSLYCTVG